MDGARERWRVSTRKPNRVRRCRFVIAVAIGASICVHIHLSVVKLQPDDVGDGGGGRIDALAPSPSDPLWPEVREAICPDTIPSPKAWNALFELARTELGLPKNNSARDTDEDAGISSFFETRRGAVGFSSNDGRRHAAYLSMYKAGSEEIGRNLAAQLSRWEDAGRGARWGGREIPVGVGRIPTALLNRTCVLAATRDPVAHFLSGYNEVEYRNAPAFMARRRNAKFRSGWENPLPYARQFDGASAARFEQFVSDFVRAPLTMRDRVLDLYHVGSLTGILRRLGELRERHGRDAPRLTAYLPSLENLGEEFPQLFNAHCPGMPRMGAFGIKAVHPTSSDPYGFYSAAKEVWRKRDGPTCRALCAIHALDYACFESIPVPAVCQRLYSERRFRDYLLLAATKVGQLS